MIYGSLANSLFGREKKDKAGEGDERQNRKERSDKDIPEGKYEDNNKKKKLRRN